MQRDEHSHGMIEERGIAAGDDRPAFRGCYGVQILIAGRQKHWRDCISAEIRRAGFNATTVDSAVDALTVLVLGLPVDVLLTDVDEDEPLGSSNLAAEVRALRPNINIIRASDLPETMFEPATDARAAPEREEDNPIAIVVRSVIEARVA